VLRNIAVPVLAPVPAFELGVVCEAFGLDRAPPGLPVYDFAVCGEQVAPVPTTSGFAVLPGHDLSRLAGADLIIVLGAAPPSPPSALVRQRRDAVTPARWRARQASPTSMRLAGEKTAMVAVDVA
jgi:hypothetical protein